MSLFKRRSTSSQPGSQLRLYYASDVHGSDRCWGKFLGAGRFYKADALIMGGDITGKAIVPIERTEAGTYRATLLGEEHAPDSGAALEKLMSAVRYNGFYPLVADRSELDRYRTDAAARDQLFEQVIVDEVRRWIEKADRLHDENGIPVYVMAGNDDPLSIDAALSAARNVVNSDDAIVRVGEHEMISCSYANPTPWDSPRELSEDDLYARMRALAEQLERPETAIFNLHVPPHDSGLDTAAQINEDLTLVKRGGEAVEIPVGSTAVRRVIEEFQPLLALHGHIHESRGATRIGRTLCINSGSEYNTGRIHGVLVTLAADEVVSHQFVVG